MITRQIEKANAGTPGKAWAIGLAAWAVPGLGHFIQKKWGRGLLLGASVFVMFLTGLGIGGHLFRVTGNDQGFSGFLQLLPMIANIGSGVLYIFCWVTNTGFTEQAQRVTYEYGNTFLLVAGLLNYLVMLDAFDIAARRKR